MSEHNKSLGEKRIEGVSRQVGICLKHLPTFSAGTNHHFHDSNVPWQRVINSKGAISPRSDPHYPREPGHWLTSAKEVRAEPLDKLLPFVEKESQFGLVRWGN